MQILPHNCATDKHDELCRFGGVCPAPAIHELLRDHEYANYTARPLSFGRIQDSFMCTRLWWVVPLTF